MINDYCTVVAVRRRRFISTKYGQLFSSIKHLHFTPFSGTDDKSPDSVQAAVRAAGSPVRDVRETNSQANNKVGFETLTFTISLNLKNVPHEFIKETFRNV